MAKYTVEHICGHKHEYNLYGAMSERDRKIEWLEGQDCPACRRAAELAKAKADTTPISAKLLPYMDKQDDAAGTYKVAIALDGGTYSRKDEIKSAGYAYGEIAGVAEYLSARRAPMGWSKVVEISRKALVAAGGGDPEPMRAEINAALPAGCEIKLEQMGIDLAVVRSQLVAAIKRAVAMETAPLPDQPARLVDRLGRQGARWNGKFYGRAGLTVYLDGDRIEVPAGIKSAWEAEWAAYKSAKAERDAQIAAACK